MVDVENHHRQRRVALPCGVDHRRQAALQEAAIVETGQRVVERHLDRPSHGLAQSIHVTLLADVCAGASQQFVSVDRAGQVVIDAELKAAKNFLPIFAISDKEDREVPRGRVRTRLTAEPQSIELPET